MTAATLISIVRQVQGWPTRSTSGRSWWSRAALSRLNAAVCNPVPELKEFGHEAMTAQAIHGQAVFQPVHALLAFAALDVVVVGALAVVG